MIHIHIRLTSYLLETNLALFWADIFYQDLFADRIAAFGFFVVGFFVVVDLLARIFLFASIHQFKLLTILACALNITNGGTRLFGSLLLAKFLFFLFFVGLERIACNSYLPANFK